MLQWKQTIIQKSILKTICSSYANAVLFRNEFAVFFMFKILRNTTNL